MAVVYAYTEMLHQIAFRNVVNALDQATLTGQAMTQANDLRTTGIAAADVTHHHFIPLPASNAKMRQPCNKKWRLGDDSHRMETRASDLGNMHEFAIKAQWERAVRQGTLGRGVLHAERCLVAGISRQRR